jgi:hypothetical protein
MRGDTRACRGVPALQQCPTCAARRCDSGPHRHAASHPHDSAYHRRPASLSRSAWCGLWWLLVCSNPPPLPRTAPSRSKQLMSQGFFTAACRPYVPSHLLPLARTKPGVFLVSPCTQPFASPLTGPGRPRRSGCAHPVAAVHRCRHVALNAQLRAWAAAPGAGAVGRPPPSAQACSARGDHGGQSMKASACRVFHQPACTCITLGVCALVSAEHFLHGRCRRSPPAPMHSTQQHRQSEPYFGSFE